MKFDILGRLRNMDLPDGKTAVLYSVYEAVSNSVHAINDRFGEDKAAANGKIGVDIELATDGEVESISVTDNGIGFTEDNIDSFETSDSRYKYQRGGKGVGRFVWIKTFKKIAIDSRYLEDGDLKRVSFRFVPEKERSIIGKRVRKEKSGSPGSTITISEPRRSQGGRMNQATFLKDLALHFLPLFISKTLPEVILTYDGESRSLTDFIADRVSAPVRREVQLNVAGEHWNINIDHLFVEPTISTELRNSYLLTAHGRLVGDPYSIERKYALKELANGKAYVAVVSGAPLDERVDQQRMSFRFNSEQREALEEAVLSGIESFLADHIKVVRDRQKRTVRTVLAEHPQLASQIANLDDYVAGLSPGMDDEQIGQNLFVLLYREERNLRKKVAELAVADNLDESSRAAVEEALHELSEQERMRLAELVVKRHQVLQTAHMLLRYSDESTERYYYEKIVHDLICPMGRMYGSGDYDDHNLWILDDSLAGYQLIASDRPIRSLVGQDGSPKEPDLVFFNPLGFRQEGTDAPITIVEFKRPGDDRPSSNPVDQVLEYIEEFRGHQVRGVDGEVISDVTETTPFSCFIVCELTEKTRRLLKRTVAQTPTPDGEGYYGWSPEHNATIQVLSFRKMLRDATTRNAAFFHALNLDSPSKAARKRAAKARTRASAGGKVRKGAAARRS
jgi:hypothetical protein